QSFAGSYHAALDQVARDEAQVTSIFCPPAATGLGFEAGLEELAPGRAGDFELVTYTEETPNEGISVAMEAPEETVAAVERMLLELPKSAEGQELLHDVFNAEGFE